MKQYYGLDSSIQEMYLQLGKKVIVPMTKRETNDKVQMKYQVAFTLNMQSLGFMPSQKLLVKLAGLSDEEFINVTEDILSALVKLAGSRVNMLPMYPDYPEVMMTLTEEQLFYDAIMHYFTMGIWEARFQERIRMSTESLLALKTIYLGSEEDMMSYVSALANSSVSMSESQKENLAGLLCRYCSDINEDMFDMKNKENMVYTIDTLYNFVGHKVLAFTLAETYVKTSTDVLRLAMAFCKADYTLATHRHDLKNLKRADRRFLLELLNNVVKNNRQAFEDASVYQGLWVIIGEMLHPGDYAKRYPKAYDFFDVMRNDKARSWYSKVEKAFESEDTNAVTDLLSKRPGEFARRLERTIRHAIKHNNNVMDAIHSFELIAEKVDSTILLQMSQFFYDKYTNPTGLRAYMPKGKLSKVFVEEDNREPLSLFYCALIAKVCREALMLQFSKKEKLGKVYIDPALKGYTVPLKQRNASKQLYSIARGSRIALPEEATTLRMYTWWKNPGHVDIDLTAMFAKSDFSEATDSVDYHDLINCDIDCVHSGDIRSAQNGAAEFIDVPIAKLKEKEVRYVVMTISSFSGTPFCDLEECFAGIMALGDLKPGEKIFDPAKSLVRSDIASAARMCTPLIYDVETHEMIWLDADVMGDLNHGPINTVTYRNSFVDAMRGMLASSYPKLIDLIQLHCFAREAEVVETPEEADLIFSLDKGITPYLIEEINTNWL